MMNKKFAVKIAAAAFAVTAMFSACSTTESGPAPENITLSEYNQILYGYVVRR